LLDQVSTLARLNTVVSKQRRLIDTR